MKEIHIKEEEPYSDYEELREDDDADDHISDSYQKPLPSIVETKINVSEGTFKITDNVAPMHDDDGYWWKDLSDSLKPTKASSGHTFSIRRPRKIHTYFCDICGRDFKKFNFMKAHILQKHLGIFEDVCPHCGKTSFDKSTLKRHIDAVHLKTYKRRRDICPDCGVSVVALKLHRQLKHGIGAKVEKVSYTCDICSLQYTKLMYLKRHIARKHLKQFNDKCPFCQKDFYNRMSVERHMQSQHPDLVPEEVKKKRLLENITSPCELCDKVFHRRANYLRHRRTVHKEVPFNATNNIKPEYLDDKIEDNDDVKF